MRKSKRADGAPAQAVGAFLLPEDPPETRPCIKCGTEKTDELFRKSKHGKSSICKACEIKRLRAAEAAKRAVDPEGFAEERRARKRKLYWKNIEKSRARNRANAASERGREINRKAVEKYKRENPERVKAQTIARQAIKRGEIKKPSRCQVAGCNCSTDIHIHHVRYVDRSNQRKDIPKDIVFVCRSHHEEIHHRRALPLKDGAGRKTAHAPKTATPRRIESGFQGSGCGYNPAAARRESRTASFVTSPVTALLALKRPPRAKCDR